MYIYIHWALGLTVTKLIVVTLVLNSVNIMKCLPYEINNS